MAKPDSIEIVTELILAASGGWIAREAAKKLADVILKKMAGSLGSIIIPQDTKEKLRTLQRLLQEAASLIDVIMEA